MSDHIPSESTPPQPLSTLLVINPPSIPELAATLFNVSEKTLSAARERSKFVLAGVDDRDGYKAADKARAKAREMRLAVEKQSKSLNDDLNKAKRILSQATDHVVVPLRLLEDNMKTQMKIVDDEADRIKAERLQEAAKPLVEAGAVYVAATGMAVVGSWYRVSVADYEKMDDEAKAAQLQMIAAAIAIRDKANAPAPTLAPETRSVPDEFIAKASDIEIPGESPFEDQAPEPAPVSAGDVAARVYASKSPLSAAQELLVAKAIHELALALHPIFNPDVDAPPSWGLAKDKVRNVSIDIVQTGKIPKDSPLLRIMQSAAHTITSVMREQGLVK